MKLIPCILICFVVGCSIGLVPGVYSSGETDGTEKNAYVIQRGSFYCIPVKCEINHHFILCNSTNSAKPGKDECIPCGHNTFNLNEKDTSTVTYHIQVPEYQVCKKPDCDCGPEGILVNRHECNATGAEKLCICNANKGYCGDDYRICDIWNGTESDIGEDWGLTPNCTIEKCEEGYTKPYPGYGACAPSTNITTTGTTQPTAPSTSGASEVLTNSTEVLTNSTEATKTTTPPSISQDKDGGLDPKIAIPLSLALLAVIIIGVWMGIFCCRNKFGQFIQRIKDAVLNNDPGDGEREHQ